MMMLRHVIKSKLVTLSYRSDNIGDDIQSVAIERLLPYTDMRVGRDDLDQAHGLNSDHKIIMNGWYASANGKPHQKWPIDTKAKVLYIGFHANNLGTLAGIPKDAIIGCRDTHTAMLCAEVGLKYWLSWCATLTLDIKDTRTDAIYLVDVPSEIKHLLPYSVAAGESLTHRVRPRCDRLEEAKMRLSLYSKATLVVTSRLHCLLPCLAMGTPVVFHNHNLLDERFLGYSNLGWGIDEAPWDNMVPKTDPAEIKAWMVPFIEALRDFVLN